MTARLGNWSRGVTGKVKGVMPWPRGEAEASASDAPITPPAPSTASTRTASAAPTAPELDSAPSDTPWYRRFWR